MATLERTRVGGRHGETAALANILAEQGVLAPHTGRPFSEAMLLGIGGGIGGGYFVFEFSGCPIVLVIGARHQWHQTDLFLAGLCERLGAPVVARETTSAKAAAGHLDAALAAGRRAIAWADLAHLPYTNVGNEWERCWIHVVGVCGADRDGAILLDDRAPIPWRMDRETFARARGSIRSNKHRLLLVDAPTGAIDLPAAIRAGLRACIDGLTNPPIKNFGLAAFEKWADLVANRKDKKGWPAVFAPGPDLLRALSSSFHAIETNGTGGGAFRPMYAEFLDEAAAVLSNAALADAAERYRALGSAWTALADALLPDAAGILGETRRLLREKERLTLERGEAAGDALAATSARLREIEALPADAFPLGEAEATDFLASVRDRLLVLAAEERATAAALGAAVGPA